MITKEELLRDLKGALSFEEELIKTTVDFYRALGWRSVVKQQHHKSIEEGLKIIKEESIAHAQWVEDMIKYVEGGDKNGF